MSFNMDLEIPMSTVLIQNPSTYFFASPTYINIVHPLTEGWSNADIRYRLASGVNLPSVGDTLSIWITRKFGTLVKDFGGIIQEINRDREGFEEEAIINADGWGTRLKWRELHHGGTTAAESVIIQDVIMKPITDDNLLSLTIETGLSNTVTLKRVDGYVHDILRGFCTDNSISFFTDPGGTVRVFKQGNETVATTFNVSYSRDYTESCKEVFNRVRLRSDQGTYKDSIDIWTESTVGWICKAQNENEAMVDGSLDTSMLGQTGTASVYCGKQWAIADKHDRSWMYVDISSESLTFDDIHGLHVNIAYAMRGGIASEITGLLAGVPKGSIIIYWMQDDPNETLPTNNYYRWNYPDLIPSIARIDQNTWSSVSFYKLDMSTLISSPATIVGTPTSLNYLGFFVRNDSALEIETWVDRLYLKQAVEIIYENTASSALYGVRDYIPERKFYSEITSTLELANKAISIIDPLASKEVSLRELVLDGTTDMDLGKYYTFVFPDGTLTYEVREINQEVDGLDWKTNVLAGSSESKEQSREVTRREVDVKTRLDKVEYKLSTLELSMSGAISELDKLYYLQGGALPSGNTLKWENVYSDYVTWSNAQTDIYNQLLQQFLQSGNLYVDYTELNLVKNGRFEYDLDSNGIPDNWTYGGMSRTLGAATVHTTSYEGTQCLRLHTTGSDGTIHLFTDAFPVHGGQKYPVSYVRRGTVPANAYVDGLAFQWYYADKSYLSTTFLDTIPFTTATWQIRNTIATSHADAKYGRLHLRITGGDPTTLDFDSFIVVRQIDYYKWLKTNMFDTSAISDLFEDNSYTTDILNALIAAGAFNNAAVLNAFATGAFDNTAVEDIFALGAFGNEAKFQDLLFSWAKLQANVPHEMFRDKVISALTFTGTLGWDWYEANPGLMDIEWDGWSVDMVNHGGGALFELRFARGKIPPDKYSFFSVVTEMNDTVDVAQSDVYLLMSDTADTKAGYGFIIDGGTLQSRCRWGAGASSLVKANIGTYNWENYHILAAEHFPDDDEAVFWVDGTAMYTQPLTLPTSERLVCMMRNHTPTGYTCTLTTYIWRAGIEYP